MLLFPTIEPNLHANNGNDDSVNNLIPFLSKHRVSATDLGAPQLEFMAGRPNTTIPTIDVLIPVLHIISHPTMSLIGYFRNHKTMSPQSSSALPMLETSSPFEVISLLAGHTIAWADNVDLVIDTTPFDSTLFTFDTQVFLERVWGVYFEGLPSWCSDSRASRPSWKKNVSVKLPGTELGNRRVTQWGTCCRERVIRNENSGRRSN
ncbi:manganese peroxidase-like protein [Mycena albidolilacea]|uniref:Manganese peroxidase-like protein n=1 Tax=Mycena albidolilacea TaxID=1033008 RepID=A0AAD7ALN0_9AGAR|nr:manganese peroxidase-like protein [Mycena albidolilacea]